MNTRVVHRERAPGFTRYSSVRVSAVVNAVTLRLPTDGTDSANAVSSWKCVANKQKPRTTLATCLQHQQTHHRFHRLPLN